MRATAVFTGLGGMAAVAVLLTVGEAHIQRASSDPQMESAVGEPTSLQDGQRTLEESAPANAGTAAPANAPASGQPASPIETAQSSSPASPPTTGTGGTPPTSSKAAASSNKAVELPRPTVEEAGILVFGERRLQIKDIVPTEPDKICTGEDGNSWPCGMMAKTALRLFLRNRTVACDLPSADWRGTANAGCNIGEQSIAAWLVQNGWVEAVAGSSLAGLGDAARQARHGIYGNDPRRRRP
ncbi:thermonuclease family protein [Rhizobium sp. BK251]|uniref:thermonuclease family protein n=1 Tax=Rhizobium sp. BK251 TaxID=2512125 RepID=UPI00104FAEAD|nr:thermonuclease family protein [Rhizobium sp. BK251]TCL75514.1 endonuclease YncB(thermonuclease family) [Rhizobium sp. BK251]